MALNFFYSQNMRDFMKRTYSLLSEDVIFICKDGSHKLNAPLTVLAACSKYFANLEIVCEGIKPLVIAVPDASLSEMECIIKFVCFGEFDDAVMKVSDTIPLSV